MVGQTISHFKITEKIGEGGMGEVYRAHDTKLNRDVALKILPQVFAQDSERMARFEREAQVLASLKKDEDTRDIPVIMLTGVNAATGLAFDKDILGAYIGAPEAFLEKPPDVGLLQSTVKRVLGA